MSTSTNSDLDKFLAGVAKIYLTYKALKWMGSWFLFKISYVCNGNVCSGNTISVSSGLSNGYSSVVVNGNKCVVTKNGVTQKFNLI